MKRMTCGLVASLLLLAGCAGKERFTVPVEEYQQRVRTLAVAPLLVDGASIEHPQAADVALMVQAEGKDLAPQLVERLRKQGGYFDVRLAATDFQRLGLSGTPAGEGAAAHLEYAPAAAAVAEVCDATVADALLVVVVHGVKRPEKRWNPHSMRLEYLSTSYSSLLWTAMVVGRDGTLLWRYVQPEGEVLLALDYADFTAAWWNRRDEVEVKLISLPGLQRTLAERSDGLFGKPVLPRLFDNLARQVADQLSPGMFSGMKGLAAPPAK